MRFLGKSLSALFTILFLLLVSTFVSSETYAQETSKTEVCPVGFLIPSSQGCKPKAKSNPARDFLPSNTLTPAKLPEKPKETETHIINYAVYVPQEAFEASTAAVPADTSGEGVLSADTLFSLVNTHREQIGLSDLQHDAQVCSVAQSRYDQIRNEIFVTHALHSGFYSMNLPYWATENMIWQNSEAEALNWWLHSPIHRSAIEGNYKYACGVCNGKVCNMVFTNYEPKYQAAAVSTAATPTPSSAPSSTPAPAVNLASGVSSTLPVRLP